MASTRIAIATMKVAQVPKPGGDFEIVEREIPKPTRGQVRIRIQACGICHSDVMTKDGGLPGIQYPRIPGHEVAGLIDELGEGVSEWKIGQRVGVGWHGGHDGTCLSCRRGDFRNCRNLQIPGISYDGGYQQFMVAPANAEVAIRKLLVQLKLPHSFAPESPRITLCVTVAHCLGISLRYRDSAALVILEFNSPANSATGLPPSAGDPRMQRSHRSSEQTCTSTVNRRMPQRNCKSWVARA